MTPSSAANLLLIAAVICWILAKQVQVAQIKPRALVIVPLVLAYFGVRGISDPLWHDGVDVALLSLGVLLSAGLGLWRGRTIAVWRTPDGVWWRRGSRLTLALWGALFLIRGVLVVIDRLLGHPEVSGLGAILVGLAVSFAAQNAVLWSRMQTRQPVFGASA